MYDNVLLPTEANPGTEQAIDLAVEFANRHDATVHVLYVDEDPDNRLAEMSAGSRREELSSAGADAISRVETAAREADVSVDVRLESGDPQLAIIEHVKRIPADFVVMGTHGRTGVDRLLIGSVAENVVRQVDVPVLVVPVSDE